MPIRTIDVREKVMARNNDYAAIVRERLEGAGVPAINLVSAPGSGKTALLERTLEALGEELGIAVIVGDVQTQNDAIRLARHTRRLVHAVTTSGACHMDARQVLDSLGAVDLNDTGLVLIENVGNLVCPAGWDLGETEKVVVFSVTEGEDKPLKYPKMFEQASLVVMSKMDLLPSLPFYLNTAVSNAMQVNSKLRFIFTSALSGAGMEEWFDYLRARVPARAFPGAMA